MPAELAQSIQFVEAELPSEAVIFGRTSAMREVRGKIERALHSDLPVLIQGESGTGKEVIGRFLHTRSSRRDAPFVKLNCTAIPVNLLESELLGHDPSSPARESDSKRGLVESAEGGTLFLDEIGEMEWGLQAKLLRLIQDGRYLRVGGREERLAHVRVVCSTNSDLAAAVERRAFRQDLLYRIDVIGLRLPPLRERMKDIPQICEYLLEKLSRQFGKKAPQLSPAAFQLLMQWKWPGNIRELENWIARIIIFGAEEVVGLELKRQLASMNPEESRGHRPLNLREVGLRRPRQHR